jgi:hypothetical protein
LTWAVSRAQQTHRLDCFARHLNCARQCTRSSTPTPWAILVATIIEIRSRECAL